MLNSGFVPSMQVWPADKTPAFLIVVLIQTLGSIMYVWNRPNTQGESLQLRPPNKPIQAAVASLRAGLTLMIYRAGGRDVHLKHDSCRGRCHTHLCGVASRQPSTSDRHTLATHRLRYRSSAVAGFLVTVGPRFMPTRLVVFNARTNGR